MGKESSRLRDHARQCREMVERAKDDPMRLTLTNMAKGLDAEADKIDSDEPNEISPEETEG